MNVLVKPQLDNGILVQELESIIQNAPQILNMVRLNLDKIQDGEGEGEGQDEQQQDVQNMLVIDGADQPTDDYAPNEEMNGMFSNNNHPQYSAHNGNLIPRDVIPEDENERTQDSALIRITEEHEETRQVTILHSLIKQPILTFCSPGKRFHEINESPDKSSQDKQDISDIQRKNVSNDNQNDEEQKYEDDYEEDDEEPVPTKPFENNDEDERQVDQAEYLKMLANTNSQSYPTNIIAMEDQPVDRPGTRNPRMQRKGESSKPDNRQNEGSLGDVKKDETNPETNKIEAEINGKGDFGLPEDSSDDSFKF